MDFKEFMKENKVDHSSNCIKTRQLGEIQKVIGAEFGAELIEYLIKYGYLGYEFVQFLGVNARQMEKSDMVRETTLLHKNFPITKNLIAFEDRGDGDYILVNSEDQVFEFIMDTGELKDKSMKLFEYVGARFIEVKEAVLAEKKE